ncbi:unnamed protein product [Symbiodinium sp. KB8]|nr:unnamed protein product [Symbiodinium sp. KB8]
MLRFLLALLVSAFSSAALPMANVSEALKLDREYATQMWRQGRGFLWFQHFRRAGGTSACHLLQAAVSLGRFVWARSEACQPEEWKLRDAKAVVGHNLSLIALELEIMGGNAFAQEYGALPAHELLQRQLRPRMRNWVFVTAIRDPWSRFWSQLRYELAPCIATTQELAVCMAGNHHLLGWWWSPTAHIDSVLGVPGFRLSESPHVYSENYYTRVLLNRTDMEGPKLTKGDYQLAKSLLFDRMSTVIITEDFARSALQLACTLGLDLETAQPLLRTRVRPYELHQAMLDIPTESELGPSDVEALRQRFAKKNSFDYSLYSHAKRLSNARLAKCARRNSRVAELRNAPIQEEPSFPPPPTEHPQLSVDDLFGCINGSVVETADGQYMLHCPRSVQQRRDSWWSEIGSPKRQLGQRLPGDHCWKQGFTYKTCCDILAFGPGGNPSCWDQAHNFTTCCEEALAMAESQTKAVLVRFFM